MNSVIDGGATLWARQTIQSEIFFAKPDKWFKIWFYLVNRVSHKDTKKYSRGETFLQQEWICEATGATSDQVKKCLTWLREVGMISTRRSTRGTWLIIVNYSHFQRLDNYYYNVEAPDKARRPHDVRTTEARRYNKNDKNDKNVTTNEATASRKKHNRLGEQVIKAFEEVNPNASRWYNNITQRGACDDLIETHGLEKVIKAVAILPKSNTMQYIPTVTTPLQLRDKWASLAAALTKRGQENITPNVLKV